MANNFVWANATTLNGTLWDSGTLLSAVPITQIGTLTVKRNSVGADKVLDAQLNNTGNIVANFDANFVDNTLVAFADGAILDNFNNFELQSGTFENVRGGIGSFNNSGTLRKTTTGNGGFGVTFNNTGTVNVESGILTIAGGGVSDGGIFNITNGKTLRFAGFGLSSYTLSNGSKISGNGNLILGYGLFDLKLSEGSAIANTVQLTVDGGGTPSDEFGLHLDTDWTLPIATTWKSGTLKSSGILTNSGSLTIDGGGRKYLNAKLNNTGNIVARPLKDPFNNRSNLEFLAGSILNNFGNFTYQSGDTGFFNGAVLNNYNNFEFKSGLIEQAEPSVGTFNNFGTFRKTNYIFNNELTGIVEIVFNNAGTVTVESGSLSLSGGGVSNKGIFNVSSGTDLKFDNRTYTLSNGTKINGNGNLTIGGQGILELKVSEGAAIANTGKFTLDGEEFRVDGDWTLPTVTNWGNGTFRSVGTLTNNGNLHLNLGGLRYLDAQLNNTGNIFQNRDSIRLSDGAILNNSGNYEVQSSGSGNPVDIIQRGNGTFNNSGTYKKTLSGVNGIGVTFNNTGTVEARSGTIDFTSIYTHNNANMILSGGKFIFRRALTINGGSIEGNGSIDVENIGMTNSGLLNPRLAGNTEFGRLSINSNYTGTNSASINIQLGGNTAGIDFDQVDINGTATFNGKLNVSLLNDFTPTLGSTFDVLTYDALNSSSNLDFTGLTINSTLQFLPQWFNSKLTLKVVDKANATVSLSVSSNTVTEDGTSSLIYTFTRTGATTSALTVNYSVGGTATLGTDYTGIAATPAAKTVTFAAGSATATVTVDPTADTTIEPDETVALTLAAGTGYTIGTTTAVTGTITNDDFPSITLAVSPAAVTEDGTAKLVYTFTRTGATTNPLTVNYTVGGIATLVAFGLNPADYIIVGSTTSATSRTVTFAAGFSTATVIVDPTPDSRIEPDETIEFTLAASSGYIIGTTNVIVGTLIDDDTTPPATTAAITGVTDNVGLIQGTVAPAGRTDDTTPTITGTISAALAAGETLRIFNGTTLLGSATVNNTALTWSYTPTLPATAGTTYSINARVADAAGNLGTASAARTFILDTTPPATTAAITAVTDNVGLIQGIVAPAGRTDDTTPTITGTISSALAAGETLRIFNGTTLLGSATVNNTVLTWSYAPTLPASAGTTYSIAARVADAAGNLGTASAARSFVLDTGVESDVPYVLEPNQSSLRLTGTRRINGTGNNLDNMIIGNSANNRIAGLGGKDILIGGGGTADRDVFIFLQLSDSLLLDPISGTGGYFDEITDFNSNDRITAPFSVETDLLTASLGNAASIAPAAIAAVLTPAAFGANSVAAFTASSHAGTFIAMNDGRAGFQADTDSIVWLRNYSISATNFVEFI